MGGSSGVGMVYFSIACGVLYGLLLFDASGFLRTGLLAAFLHEWEVDCLQ